jgi:hypothetical protein
VPTAQSAKQKRKRCQNCNKLFVPARNVPDQKFCKDACRREFWTHGSAFGPMKAGLYSAIDKKYAALQKEVAQRLRAIVDCAARLEVRIVRLEERAALLERSKHEFEDHTHEVHSYSDYGSTHWATGAPNRTVEQAKPDARSR